MKKISALRQLRYLAEAALLAPFGILFRALPLDAASALGSWLARLLGPHLRLSHHARTNLALVFPEKTQAEHETLLRGMWDNLGRVAAELPHLRGNALLSRISYSGLHHLPPRGQPAVFISAHYGNWELTYPSAYEHGVPVALIYRHINNPIIDRWLARLRGAHASNMMPKGFQGAAKLARALKRGESLALLIDQKMNEGVPVSFFGRDAMTAPAGIELALRFNMPILLGRVARTKGAHFQAALYPPLAVIRTGDDAADVKAALLQINRTLEGWIREHPEQWFWVHRRWGKELYETGATGT